MLRDIEGLAYEEIGADAEHSGGTVRSRINRARGMLKRKLAPLARWKDAMKCGHARRLFGAYWDDEITQAEREWLEAHFASCATCRGEYGELARTVDLLGELPRVEVSHGFAVVPGPGPPALAGRNDRLLAGAPRWVAVTATAVLLAVLGGMVMQWTGMPLAPRRTVSHPNSCGCGYGDRSLHFSSRS